MRKTNKKIMEQTFLGLSLWAWLGYLFLVLSGIFLGIASTNSTKTVVQESVKDGVDSTLQGTQSQLKNMEGKLVNPKRTLHAYLINIHKPVHTELLNKLLMKIHLKNVMEEKNKGERTSLKGGDDIKLQDLQNALYAVINQISGISNKYYASMETLRDLTKKTDDPKIAEIFKIYDTLNQDILDKTNSEESNNYVKEIETKIELSKSIYDSIITQTE